MHKEKDSDRKKTTTAPGFKGRVWIDGIDGTFLGYGRIVLLEQIREHGSITKAAKSMNMSYRHAWELVDSMNSQVHSPLVDLATGGKGGGGASLTTEGEKAIRLFWDFYNEFQVFLKKEQARWFRNLPLRKSAKRTKSAP